MKARGTDHFDRCLVRYFYDLSPRHSPLQEHDLPLTPPCARIHTIEVHAGADATAAVSVAFQMMSCGPASAEPLTSVFTSRPATS